MAEPARRVAIVGSGRMGRALTAAMPDWEGPFGRGFDGTLPDGATADVVLLAVPDGEISRAAACVRGGPLVGHTAGALGLEVLAPHECFAVHPLMTVPLTGADLRGAGAAVAGSSERSRALAFEIARLLGMEPFEIADADRAAYHASASIASNFLVTLEDAAEQLLATTGSDRRLLLPLVRAALDNWAEHGGERALTGPIARGDEATVQRQRAAVAERTPELLAWFDQMCARTRALAARSAGRRH
ncbi:MAG: Rossmann-like and DUF2520 domain-containing protein [Acidimicrobiales bacterium]